MAEQPRDPWGKLSKHSAHLQSMVGWESIQTHHHRYPAVIKDGNVTSSICVYIMYTPLIYIYNTYPHTYTCVCIYTSMYRWFSDQRFWSPSQPRFFASVFSFPRSDRVTRLTLDVGHLLMAGENPAQSVAMAGWIIIWGPKMIQMSTNQSTLGWNGWGIWNITVT